MFWVVFGWHLLFGWCWGSIWMMFGRHSDNIQTIFEVFEWCLDGADGLDGRTCSSVHMRTSKGWRCPHEEKEKIISKAFKWEDALKRKVQINLGSTWINLKRWKGYRGWSSMSNEFTVHCAMSELSRKLESKSAFESSKLELPKLKQQVNAWHY